MLWCAKIPVITVPLGDTPKRLTLVLPYYENRAFFGQQIRHWLSYPAPLRQHFSVIVVDDGSPHNHASEVLTHYGFPTFIRLFRIEVDVRWNWLAARNIGAHYAEDGWLLLTDMDHVLPAETLHALVYGQHDPHTVYAFQRQEHTGEKVHPHSASFFLTKRTFWRTGGYDEALSGHYGSDGEFRSRLAKVAPFRLLPQHLVRHEYQGDSSTTAYLRKQPEDATVRRLVAARKPGWKPRTLSFPYHEVPATFTDFGAQSTTALHGKEARGSV